MNPYQTDLLLGLGFAVVTGLCALYVRWMSARYRRPHLGRVAMVVGVSAALILAGTLIAVAFRAR